MNTEFQTILAIRNFLEDNSDSISRIRSGKQMRMFIHAVLTKMLKDNKFKEAVLIYGDISAWRYDKDKGMFFDSSHMSMGRGFTHHDDTGCCPCPCKKVEVR